MNARRLFTAAFRQSVFGLIAVGLSLPLLLALSHRLGLGDPPVSGLILLGGSVLLAFAGGGFLGALLAGAGVRSRPAAALLGLVYGMLLCSVTLPVYTDDVLDALTDQGTEEAIGRIGPVLAQPDGAVDQAVDVAGKLAQESFVYIPALALLGWTLVGPALAAPLEAKPRLPNGRAQIKP